MLFVQGSLGEQTYSVGSAAFPVLDIDEASAKSVFKEAEFELVAWETTAKLSTHYFAVFKSQI